MSAYQAKVVYGTASSVPGGKRLDARKRTSSIPRRFDRKNERVPPTRGWGRNDGGLGPDGQQGTSGTAERPLRPSSGAPSSAPGPPSVPHVSAAVPERRPAKPSEPACEPRPNILSRDSREAARPPRPTTPCMNRGDGVRRKRISSAGRPSASRPSSSSVGIRMFQLESRLLGEHRSSTEAGSAPEAEKRQDDPTIGKFVVALLRFSSPESIETGLALCRDISVRMAHGFFDWGADLELQDARETRSAYQTLDGGIIWKVVEAVWNGDATMEDALKTAHVSKGSAIQVYKVFASVYTARLRFEFADSNYFQVLYDAGSPGTEKLTIFHAWSPCNSLVGALPAQSNKGGSKSVAKTGKSMKKLSMKVVRKTALKQIKKVAKKTMKKSMKVAKTPKKSKSRSPAYPNPKHFDMIAIKEHDSRDAEGNVNFWSKDNPDKMEELREEQYEAWRDVYDFGSSYIIGGVRVKSDPWPVWFAGPLEEAGWVLKANKGRHQRWELEDDS
eukprot:symbB.v1.2.023754.t1/scaffold2198.1/size86077/4